MQPMQTDFNWGLKWGANSYFLTDNAFIIVIFNTFIIVQCEEVIFSLMLRLII